MSDLRRARLRLEISRAAVRLFSVHGVAATSGERIAEEVGLSSRSLWRYFRAKEECVETVLTRSVERSCGPCASGRPTARSTSTCSGTPKMIIQRLWRTPLRR